MDLDLQTINFVLEARTLKVRAQRFQIVSPCSRIATENAAPLRTLTDAARLAVIHLLSEARTRVPARVSHKGPANGILALAVVMNVLLRFV